MMLQPDLTIAQRRIYQAAIGLFAEKGIAHVSVRELAEKAGVARGTIYNHVKSIEHLFEDVASNLTNEMNQRMLSSFRNINDPDLRIAYAIRLYVRRAHTEPEWGLFVSRFAFNSPILRRLGAGMPIQILIDGVQRGHYTISADQVSGMVTMICSSVLGAMYLVREGLRTWRDAGSDCAEMILRALGVPAARARQLAHEDLSVLGI